MSALLLALAIVAAFATGRLAYATTNGISMLPVFHTGDLVIVRAAGSYHVGEIVEYKSPLLHTTVLHRIVAETNGLFTFKGDNNSFLDPVHLPSSAIVGTLLFHIPRGGLVVDWIRQPVHAALAAAVIFGLVALAEARPRRALAAARGRRGRHLATRRRSGNGRLIVGTLGVIALGVLTLEAFRVPAVRTAHVADRYSEKLVFSYRATAAPSTTYPTGEVTTGSPVFLQLVHTLDVHAAFSLHAAAPSKIRGTIAFEAVIDASDGWSRTLVGSPAVPFSGSVASATLAVPLDRAIALLQQSAQETGIGIADGQLIVIPTVAVRGTVAGESVLDTMSPPLTFDMNPLEVNLPSDQAQIGSTAAKQFTNVHSGSVEREITTRGSLTLAGHQFDVGTARVVGAVGSVLALALSLAGLAQVWRRRGTSELAKTLRRFRHEIVPIESDASSTARAVVDVATIAALADLADRFDVALLDYENDGEHTYFADIGEMLYRYRSAAGDGATDAATEGDLIQFLKPASSQ